MPQVEEQQTMTHRLVSLSRSQCISREERDKMIGMRDCEEERIEMSEEWEGTGEMKEE